MTFFFQSSKGHALWRCSIQRSIFIIPFQILSKSERKGLISYQTLNLEQKICAKSNLAVLLYWMFYRLEQVLANWDDVLWFSWAKEGLPSLKGNISPRSQRWPRGSPIIKWRVLPNNEAKKSFDWESREEMRLSFRALLKKREAFCGLFFANKWHLPADWSIGETTSSRRFDNGRKHFPLSKEGVR